VALEIVGMIGSVCGVKGDINSVLVGLKVLSSLNMYIFQVYTVVTILMGMGLQRIMTKAWLSVKSVTVEEFELVQTNHK
jgi:hypothetical protein